MSIIVTHEYKAPFGDIPNLRLHLISRWSVIKTKRKQSVAEHSYNVAMIVQKICNIKGMTHSETCAMMVDAMLHDTDEVYTGDIPSPAKISTDKNGPLKHPIVKLADNIESFIFIRDNCCDTDNVCRWIEYNLRTNIDKYSAELGISELVYTLMSRVSL